MFKKLYLVFGVCVILFYGTAALLGWEFGTTGRNQLPPDARQNGYRSFGFWHTSFHGGK